MENLYNFTKDDKNFTSEYYRDDTHPDGVEYKYDVKIDGEDLIKEKIVWYQKSSAHFHLGYVGFKKKFRNKKILKNYLHPHCTEYLKRKGVERITLKPLYSAFIIWVILGFEFENEIEELEVKRIIKEFLKDYGKGLEEDFWGGMRVGEIVQKYKELLRNYNFPPRLKQAYYTNLVKVLQ